MSLHRNSAALVAAGLLTWAPVVALAQGSKDLDQLESRLKGLAEQTVPKTVLIRAIAGPGREGAGSGAIISPDGYILTCTHVVEIGKSWKVTTSDGKVYDAKLLGRSVAQDYALIKIEAKGLSTFTIGDSDTVKAGDWVAALGHPGGPYNDVQPAFAAGRVRALGMKLPVGMMKKYYNNAIMTDVPIYAGDSGGPLVNSKGELVGINGAIVQINEMAFAVPINQVMADIDRMKKGEVIPGEQAGPEAFKEMQKVISPEDYQKMTRRMFKNFGKAFGGGGENPFGKLFGGENGENPFGKLFGGENGEMPDLGKLFGGEGGEMPDLGKLMDPDGPFGKLFGGKGENPFARPDRSKPAPSGKKAYLGLRAAEDSDLGGVLVEEVQPKGPAAVAGLQEGDLIISVGGRRVKSVADFRAVMKKARAGKVAKFKVVRSEFSEGDLIEVERTIRVTLGGR